MILEDKQRQAPTEAPSAYCADGDTNPAAPSLLEGIYIDIPGFKQLSVEHLVLDFNGTLAVDGTLRPGVRERLEALAARLHIEVVTADTFGTAARELKDLPVRLVLLSEESQAKAKRIAVLRYGSERVIAIGNGRNDQQMIATAAIGILVIQQEGASGAALAGADIVVTSVLDALDLLLNPRRLVATLRA